MSLREERLTTFGTAISEWKAFGEWADVSQPPRTKAVLVSPKYGTPFLVANQMFSIRPHARKWLAIGKLAHSDQLFVKSGDILVRRSADVGRSTLAVRAHEKHLISDHFLRIEPLDEKYKGWIYAFIRSPQCRSMMKSAKYGHIIQHIEISHLRALPLPTVSDGIADDFNARVEQILDARNEGDRLALEADSKFEKALGIEKPEDFDVNDWGNMGYSDKASKMFSGNRRFEGSFYNPSVVAIRDFLAERGQGFSNLRDANYRVWVPGRYKRIPDENGVDYYDSANILETCPQPAKKFADCSFGDEFNGRVDREWLLMPSSGQVYGIIGNVVLASDFFHNQVVSNHVIRIAPNKDTEILPGYVSVALSHRRLGQPLVKSLAFGSSVPEISPHELSLLPVVRLSQEEEKAIADLAEAAAASRSRADVLERALAVDAEVLLDRFIAGESLVTLAEPFAKTVVEVDSATFSQEKGETSQYSDGTRGERFIMLKERLESFEQLQDNWDEDGAERPNALAISRARLALYLLVEMDLEPSTILPSVDDGVGIAFESENRYAEIEFANDGEMAVLIDDSTPKAWAIETENDIRAALEEVQRFISGA